MQSIKIFLQTVHDAQIKSARHTNKYVISVTDHNSHRELCCKKTDTCYEIMQNWIWQSGSIHLISPLSRITFTAFLKTNGSLSRSQKPTTGPCTHPNESRPHHTPTSLQIQFTVPFPIMIMYWKESLSCILNNKNFVCISHLPHVWCVSHHFPWTLCHKNIHSTEQIM